MTSHHASSLKRLRLLVACAPMIVAFFATFHGIGWADESSSIMINKYAVLDADAKKGDATFTVHLSSDPQVPPIKTLNSGDLLLIVQMQGATIRVPTDPNDASYGEIVNLNGAGVYELVKVASYQVDDRGVGTVTIQGACSGLQHDYSAAGHTQVVLVPQSTTFTVDPANFVTAPPWNGDDGGIVALKTQSLVMNNNIVVTGEGFRGGSVDTMNDGKSANDLTSVYYSSVLGDGGAKGESIAGFTQECTIRGDCLGRGASANGGGGGDNHGAGGGGGANPSNGNAWTGQGVMDPSFTTAWMLDPGYHGNLSISSGGGRGGYSFSDTNAFSPLTLGPGDSRWLGNQRRNVGGLGGRTLPSDGTVNRIFFGGGGGAGHATNNAGSHGGPGGGIIFIIANQISGTGKIIANGQVAGVAYAVTTSDWLDAPGGGGGGGSILIYSDSIVGTQLEAKGGMGGDQLIWPLNGHPEQANGAGGGGGGGKISISNAMPVFTSVDGGAAGTTNVTTMTSFPVNGATGGSSGVVDLRPDFGVASLSICQSADLAINVTASNVVADPTLTFSYQVVVTNHGPSSVVHAPVAATLSTPTLNSLGWTCSPTAACGQINGTNDIDTTVTLDPNASATFLITVPAPFDPGTASKLVYTAQVNAPKGVSDPDLSNNKMTLETPIGSNTGISVGPSNPGSNSTGQFSLNGGGFLGGCSLIDPASPGTGGSLLEVLVMSTMLIISRMVRRIRRVEE